VIKYIKRSFGRIKHRAELNEMIKIYHLQEVTMKYKIKTEKKDMMCKGQTSGTFLLTSLI
jgi:hypothetical protein